MFTEVATEDALRDVRAHDFGADPAQECGANRIDAITALERVVASARAEQAAQISALHAERVEVMGLGRGDPTVSVIGEVAMARNVGPGAAGTQVGVALSLERLQAVAALFGAGLVPEAVVRAVVTESASLHGDDKIVLDGEISEMLPGLTARQASHATARMVIRLDAEAARERAERNRADQRVSMFPDTDGVAILQVRGPAEQILATHQALDARARALKAAGDERTLGQIMVQTLVQRVTGLVRPDDIDVEVQLVMDAKTLLGEDGEPVHLVGYGPISPDIADDLIARAPDPTIRRLLVDPVDGTLVVRDLRRRRFTAPSRSHIRARDRVCRQPGCDLQIRDDDHIHAFADGGLTTAANGQGLCKRSHTIKSQPGWVVTTEGKANVWQTPTGHNYRSDPPAVLPRDGPGTSANSGDHWPRRRSLG
ncbi:HNH endonuclease [Aeromicrobium sp.]|uniref:HNH endonuclease signature motif containing protein n=1 Tax=Aeromicrobium sp. TaxID=1871063 RepID=UPI0030BE2ACB